MLFVICKLKPAQETNGFFRKRWAYLWPSDQQRNELHRRHKGALLSMKYSDAYSGTSSASLMQLLRFHKIIASVGVEDKFFWHDG